MLPFLLLAILVAAQLALAGQALWSAAVAARADLVGRSPEAAARAALPTPLRDEAKVGDQLGGVAVKVPVPRLLPELPQVNVGAGTKLSPSGG